MGARPLGRIIQEHIKKPLAEEVLFGKLKRGGVVKVAVKEDGSDLVSRSIPASEAATAAPQPEPEVKAKKPAKSAPKKKPVAKAGLPGPAAPKSLVPKVPLS